MNQRTFFGEAVKIAVIFIAFLQVCSWLGLK